MDKSLARLYSSELEGIDAKLIEIEADINVGLHSFGIVGLADRSLNEAKERVNSALKNSGAKPPNRENRKITINLAPAELKKAGSHYDLAIALAYLLATKQIAKFDPKKKIFLGELALDGRLRPVSGALNVAEMAAREGFEFLLLPKENAREAAPINSIKVIPLEDLSEAIEYLSGKKEIAPEIFKPSASAPRDGVDISEIKGQGNAKRALTIAVAGGHNILFTGPPGVGKSFLARSTVGIMPKLTMKEAIEVTKIWSAAGYRLDGLICDPPFRAPHQTISTPALAGGGGEPRPGEISLAHRGVLFLDELPEFQSSTLEALRQPLESGTVHIARAKKTLIFPAKFTLIAAMNPCPCGYYGAENRECICRASEVIKYQKRISGPLLDRIDIQVKVGTVKVSELGDKGRGSSENILTKEAIERTREVQARRFGIGAGKTNSEMTSREAQTTARFEAGAEKFLGSLNKTRLSPRGYYRVLKVARTIADLDQEEKISAEHLAEAFGYRIREAI